MANHPIQLKHSAEIAEGTMAFHFHKPAGFQFKPGQAVDLVLADPANPTGEGMRHAFSIVSAPFEDELVFATRMRDSAYKRALRVLTPGAQVAFDGAFGSLALHKDRTRPAVFIAGGIGITPFMSILRQAAQDRLPQQLLLLYSNRRPEDAAFLAELQALEKQHENFRLVATMTGMDKSNQPWQGATAQIDAAFLREAAGTLVAPVYYMAGPPGMVEAMRQILSDMDIDEGDIRSEDFYGY